MSYSKDMRQAALCQVRSGKTRLEVARMFSVGEATIYRWQKNEGRRNGKPGPKEGRKVTQQRLRSALSKRPDAKLAELGRMFDVDPTTICHACKKWKITRKKNVGLRRAGRYEKKGVPASS